MDTTRQGTMAEECSAFFETIITVQDWQINAWAAGGGNTFFFAQHTFVPPYCRFNKAFARHYCPIGPMESARIQAVLEYSYAVVNYAVKKPVNQIVASGTLTGNTTTVTLPPGNYTVMYTTTDNVGLTGMTSFTVTVRDTVKPKAICKPVVIMNLDPGGVVDTLLPGVINNGSFDNCTPTPNLTYSVFPFEFNCKQAGSNLNVTLTVTDSSGNSAACTTIVGVFTIPPVPTYTPVCENGTLQLFANPPSSLPFLYQWSGQNGMFGSNQADPIVDTNAMAIHNGLYCVTITGGTGCTSSACVQVSLAILGTTPELESTNGVSFCPGQTINLTTDNYSGSSVKYWWAVDSVPALPAGPILLDTTMMPIFNINNPPPGNYVYYVKVFYNGCNTTYSNPLLVSMHPKPPAAVKDAQILICEGQSLMLQSTTPSTGGLTYFWTGPGSFTSNAPSPSVTDSADKAMHEGVYTLTTMQNGCVSDPVTVTVTINPKPSKPQLSGNLDVCAGQTATLVCNIASAFEWNWTSPSFQTFTTNQGNGGNMWQILNASAADTGYWRVIVVANGCPSDESDPILVRVQQYPVITASSNAPICQDSLLKLTANYASVDPITSWCWAVPVGDPICMVQNPIIPNGSSGIYQVIGATSFGCSATATVSVTIVAPPVIQSVTSDAPPCCNNNTLITFSADVMPTPNSYTWTGPGFANGTAQGANPMLGPTNQIGDCGPFNGQYTLVVKNAAGCPSLAANTNINIQAPPAQPVLEVNPPQPVCAGTNVLIKITNPNTEPGATYIWNRPAPFQDTTTSAASLSIPNAQAWQSGAYTVTAISGNGICQSGPSETITLTIHPIPATPSISSDSPVCEDETLSLTASTVPGTYNWIGPGFSSQEQNPHIPLMTPAKGGLYTLSVTKDGCTSPSASLTVEVVATPETPQIATPPEKICIDGPVSTFLNIQFQSPVNGMEYTWLDAATQIVLQGPSTVTSLFLGLPNILALGPGQHSFLVFATTPTPKACNSAFSNIVTVRFDTVPAGIIAFAGLDHPACIDSAILLTSTPSPLPGTVTGLWTQTGGLDTIIYDATTPNAYFFGVTDSVYTFQWSLSNGACTNFSSAEVTITAQMPEIANGGPDIYSCETTGIHLQAIQGVTTQGIWTQFSQQSNLGIDIDDSTFPNTTISGKIERGGLGYTFYWEIGNPGCGKSVDPVGVFVYNVDPDAGSNQFICNNNDCAQLEASAIAFFESGTWSSPDTTLKFTITTPNTATVCGLKPGNNIIYWTINNGVCGDRSRDTLEVYYEIFPTAVNDFVSVPFGDTAHVLVLANDILPTNYTVTVTIPPVNGRILDTLATGVYVYRPQSGYTGMDEMTYRICNTNCPDACSFATVKFAVGGIPECFIPSIITPNGDGFNDQLKIPEECTLGEGAANLEVTIFNQWGDLVFHAKPYLNDWEGTYNNENLPAGTYFYVVKLDENDKPRTGFLLIQR